MYTGGRSFHWKYFQVLAQLQECAATYTDSGRRQGSSLFAAAATCGRTRTLPAATCGRCQCMCSPIPATCGRQLKLDKFARFFCRHNCLGRSPDLAWADQTQLLPSEANVSVCLTSQRSVCRVNVNVEKPYRVFFFTGTPLKSMENLD